MQRLKGLALLAPGQHLLRGARMAQQPVGDFGGAGRIELPVHV